MHALLLFVPWLVRAALADEAVPPRSEQKLVYDLLVDGKTVGHRDVTVRYLPPDDLVPAETRIIESLQELETTIKGLPVKMRTRSSARSSDSSSSFVSSHELNGKVSEVQGHRDNDGRWLVTILAGGKVSTWEYRRSEVDLTTMDLVDPAQPPPLNDNASAKVLVAEAGVIMTGVVRDLDESKVKVGGRQVPVHRWDWTPPDGKVELSWSLDGVLVDYEAAFMGTTLDARLRQLPEPRTFGTIDMEPLKSGDTKVIEEDL